MNIVIDSYLAFYISAAIMMLAVAIVAYPTLRAQSKNKK